MKPQYILLGLFFLCNIVFAQNDTYYYFKENKITLSKKLSKLSITAKRTIQKSDLATFNFKPYTIPSNELDTNDVYFEVELNNNPSLAEYNQIINTLNQNPKVVKTNPFFGDNESDFGMTNFFYVKLKNKNDLQKLQAKANEFQAIIVEQNKFMPLWFTLVITKNTPYNTLVIANLFKESGIFDAAQPDFNIKIEANCTNDPLITNQWAFSNPIAPDVTMNVCNAWQYSKGEGINVAVVDEGIDINHPDLAANIHPLSYDCMTGTSPAILYGAHGTWMSGIIGAIENNNKDMAGIAPKCKIMNISTAMSGSSTVVSTSRIKRADGINWAWMNGADIINCSWGFNNTTQNIYLQPLYESIELALRNGRGCIVIFASGNRNFSSIISPQNYFKDILVVGAANQTGSRWFNNKFEASNFGTDLDVVAPGNNLITLYPNNNTGNTFATSPAAAHASGLAALILGTDPDLSAGEVNDVIEKTAKKLFGYTYNYNYPNRPNGIWNNEVGYGLINANDAVATVFCSETKLHNQTFNGTQSFANCKILSNNSIVRTGKTTYTVIKKALLNNNFEVKSDAQFEIKTW